jgi:hypothetical protein
MPIFHYAGSQRRNGGERRSHEIGRVRSQKELSGTSLDYDRTLALSCPIVACARPVDASQAHGAVRSARPVG